MGNPNQLTQPAASNEPGILVHAREGARPITTTSVTEDHLIVRIDGIRSLGYWVELRLTRSALTILSAKFDAFDAAMKDIERELDVLLDKGPPPAPADPPAEHELVLGRVVTIPAAIPA